MKASAMLTKSLIIAAILWLAGARAWCYFPPTSGTHGNPGDFNYQLADGGPDSHGWFGKDPSTCNPDSFGFCSTGACFNNSHPWCVGFSDIRIIQQIAGVDIVESGGQSYFQFDIHYELPNLYCLFDLTDPTQRPPDSQIFQMWLSTSSTGSPVFGPGSVAPWFERGFWKPRIALDCTTDFVYLVIQNCDPTTQALLTRVVGPYKLPERRLVNGVCRPIDPRKCGVTNGPGSGVLGPVNVGSGDVHYTERLISIAGAPGSGLDLTMGYASSQSNVGMFGTGWSSTLSQTMEAVSGTGGNLLHRRTPENFDEYYTFDAAALKFLASSPGELRGSVVTESGTVWALTDLDGTVTRFEIASGRWLSTTDRWGNATTANYAGLPGSFSVSDPDGRTLTFTLSGGFITQVTDSDTNTWKFIYSGNYLFQILDPFHISSGYWRQYDYGTITGLSPNPLATVKDEQAKVLEGHAYDSLGRATSSYAEGNKSYGTIAYATPGVGQTTVTTQIDAVTNQTTIFDTSYIAGRYLPTRVNGNCASCDGADGDDQSFTYDAGNHVLTKKVGSVDLGEQVETDFTYDANGMVLTRTEAGIRTTTYTYAQGTPTGFLKPWQSFVTSVTENSVVKVSPQLTKTTSYSWSSSGTCSGAGAETCLQTTVTGYLNTVDPGTSYQTTTRFDSKHRPTEVDGPELVGGASANHKTTFSYFGDIAPVALNLRGRLQKTSVFTAVSVSLDTQYDNYDVFGTARTIVDPNVVETDKTTDQKGRLLTVVSKRPPLDPSEPADYTTTYFYDLRDRLTKLTLPGPSPSGNQIQYVYEDGTNRLTDTIRADEASDHNQKERLRLTLNVIGNKVQEDAQVCSSPLPLCSTWVTPSARKENFKYDAHDRLSEIDHPIPSGSKILYIYDSRGNLKTVQDENHVSANTTYAYDSLNRLISATQTLTGASGTSGTCAASANQIKTCYTYDSQDNLISVTDPNGNPTNYTYDDFRRMQSQASPVSGTMKYSYDAAGNLTKSVDARQGLNPSADGTSRAYDAANRILSSTAILAGQATETTSWTYDDAVATHYGKGRVATMADPSGSTFYAYERRGLLKHEARTIDFNTYTLAYGYDPNGNRSSITYPSGRIVTYTFDFADRPSSASSGGVSYVTSAGYQPFGPESSLSYGNGTTRTMTVDQRYRPTELKLQGTSVIYDFFYSEDAVGNFLSICAASGTCSTSANPYNRVFTYDDLNRLTSANSGSSLWLTGGYAYDSMGNMTSATLGSTARAFTYLLNGASKNIPKLASTNESGIGMRNVTYDLSGNETMVGSGSFTYSSRNYLASGDGLGYTYDGRGLRVSTSRTGAILFPVSLTVEPQSVKGGGTATGTVTLNDTTGGTVTLASSDASVTFPGGSTVPVVSPSTSATFNITTTTPASDQKVVITATMNQVAVTAVLKVTINTQLRLLSLSPRTVHGGSSSTGTITLNGPAPSPSGAPVMLTSSDTSVATVTSPVTVPGGSTTTTFPINTFSVTSSKSADIKATYPTGVDFHASLVVVNYAVQRAPEGLPGTRNEHPLLLASLWPSATSAFGGRWTFRDSEPVGFQLNLGLERETDDPPVQRAPVILVGSPPGPPKRNVIYSPEMKLLAESELARPREKAILYEYIWFNGHPVAQVDAGVVTHWTFTDHLGTPLIQTTDSQAVWWRAEYEPYGRVFAYNPPGQADQHQPLRLPGQEAEQLNLGQNGVTERSYNIFRWYRPSWGRYTQPDPIGLKPLIPSPRFSRAPDSNLFAYVTGNPLGNVDPLGLLVNLGCMSGVSAEAAKCYPMLSQMIAGLNRMSKGTFNVTCNAGETGTKPVVNGPKDDRTFTVNIGVQTPGCSQSAALIHEIGELYSIMLGYPVHNVLFPSRDDSHAWGTDLEKIFCLRCCCPCPSDIRNKSGTPAPSVQ